MTRPHPVASGCLVILGLVVLAVAVLAGVGRGVPTFLPEVGLAALSGALGVSLPAAWPAGGPPGPAATPAPPAASRPAP